MRRLLVAGQAALAELRPRGKGAAVDGIPGSGALHPADVAGRDGAQPLHQRRRLGVDLVPGAALRVLFAGRALRQAGDEPVGHAGEDRLSGGIARQEFGQERVHAEHLAGGVRRTFVLQEGEADGGHGEGLELRLLQAGEGGAQAAPDAGQRRVPQAAEGGQQPVAIRSEGGAQGVQGDAESGGEGGARLVRRQGVGGVGRAEGEAAAVEQVEETRDGARRFLEVAGGEVDRQREVAQVADQPAELALLGPAGRRAPFAGELRQGVLLAEGADQDLLPAGAAAQAAVATGEDQRRGAQPAREIGGQRRLGWTIHVLDQEQRPGLGQAGAERFPGDGRHAGGQAEGIAEVAAEGVGVAGIAGGEEDALHAAGERAGVHLGEARRQVRLADARHPLHGTDGHGAAGAGRVQQRLAEGAQLGLPADEDGGAGGQRLCRPAALPQRRSPGEATVLRILVEGAVAEPVAALGPAPELHVVAQGPAVVIEGHVQDVEGVLPEVALVSFIEAAGGEGE